MSTVNRLGEGIRTTVASRDYWQQWGVVPVNIRREIIAESKAILAASAVLSAGQTTGTVGDLFRGVAGGDPSVVGGPGGRDMATVFARVPYYDPNKTYGPGEPPESYKSVSEQVPWDTPLWEIYGLIAAAAGDLAEEYGAGEPDLTEIDYTVY